MTREVAIKAIQDFIGWFKEDSLIRKALEMAIKALSQEQDMTIAYLMGKYEDKEPCDTYTEGYFKGYDDGLEQKLEEPYLTESEKVICNIYLDDLDRQSAESENPCNEYRIIKSLINASRKEPCEDAVSREDAIRKLRADTLFVCTGDKMQAISDIEGLPPVTQKSGKWIEHPEIETSAPEYLMFYECSECGDKQCFCKSDIHKKRFCNNCGAKMVEPQESEE